jgi:hypothetical protein
MAGFRQQFAEIVVLVVGGPRGWVMKSTSLTVIAGLGALVLGAAQQARAADLYVARPLLTPDSSWTGFYGGINLGGFASTGTAQWNPLPSPSAFGFNGTTTSLDTDGVAVGIQAGYNLQLSPSWVTGIEGDITNDHTSARVSSPGRRSPPMPRSPAPPSRKFARWNGSARCADGSATCSRRGRSSMPPAASPGRG